MVQQRGMGRRAGIREAWRWRGRGAAGAAARGGGGAGEAEGSAGEGDTGEAGGLGQHRLSPWMQRRIGECGYGCLFVGRGMQGCVLHLSQLLGRLPLFAVIDYGAYLQRCATVYRPCVNGSPLLQIVLELWVL